MNKTDSAFIYEKLCELYPDAHCELNYGTVFQLAVAVMLSAQTTDVSVNRVTPVLFNRYPDAVSLSQARTSDVEEIIRSIGLYRNKARNIITMSKTLAEHYGGNVPDTMEQLTQLPGIGRKSANVIMSEGFKQPAIAVDTHVHRVSWRLGIAEKTDTPEKTEEKLMKAFPREQWSRLHHLLIFFGRYTCHSRKPECGSCLFKEICKEKQL
jgi:endonuclease-3